MHVDTYHGLQYKYRRSRYEHAAFAELSFADREWSAAAPDQYHAAAAGEVLQGASGLPGRRPGGLSRGTTVGPGAGGQARPLADRRGGAVSAGPGVAARAPDCGEAFRLAVLLAAAGGHPRNAFAGRAVAGVAAARGGSDLSAGAAAVSYT